MLVPLFLLPGVLLGGCAAEEALADKAATGDTGDDTGNDTGDSADSGDDDTALPENLNGAIPAAPIALPTFSARNQLGEARSEADLVGHPTVLWFYPAAGTYG